jgi:hypothetical protein
VTLLLALSGVAFGQEVQYRHFSLSDGREFDAIILETQATGFRVQVPQGETTVSFAQLFDMAPITKAQYDAQGPWVVYLAAPEERKKGLAAAFQAIPKVVVYGMDASADSRLTADQASLAASCGTQVDCISKALADAPWLYIVSVDQQGAELVVGAQTNKGGALHNPLRASMVNSDQVANIGWTALEVKPYKGETTTNTNPDETGPKAAKAGTILAPIPGMPAMARGDGAGVGIALGVAIPATAIWVGATGKGTHSTAGHAVMAVGGYYAICVAVNAAVATRKLDGETGPTTMILPTEHGGVAAQVGFTF